MKMRALILQTAVYCLTSAVSHSQQDNLSGCEKITAPIGAEDMAVDWQRGQIYISSHDRRNFSQPGQIFRFDPATQSLEVLSHDLPDLKPHGIDLWIDTAGERWLFVVNHTNLGHTIEKFHISSVGLTSAAVFRSRLLTSPNDIAVKDDNSFYVTNDGFESGWRGLLRSTSSIAKYDGRWSVFDNKPWAANGIAVLDGHLVVADSRRHGVHVYKNALAHERTLLAVTEGIDNLIVDPQGTLWTAGHPDAFKFLRHRSSAENRSPTQAVRFRLDLTTPEVLDRQTVVTDDGTVFSAASVAVPFADKVYLGAVFDAGILACPGN